MKINGTVTGGPELHFTRLGKAVCNLKLEAELEGHRQILRVVAWEKKAEEIAESIDTGDVVTLEGRFKKRNWTDREGAVHEIEEFVIYG